MHKLKHLVRPEEDGRPLDRILSGSMGLSRHRISSLKFSGGILLDGKNVHTDHPVHAGQTVCLVLAEKKAQITPWDVPLCIPYRDDDLLVADKPAPMPSIHSARQDTHTLENAVYAWLGCPDRFAYRPVSRLDKGTSGLMPIALNAPMHSLMQKLLHTDSYVREYLAVTEGAPPESEGLCRLPIGTGEGIRRRIAPDGRPAATHYRVLRQSPNGRCLLRLRLMTGRTHQIRVHMQALGCPIAGDYLYGRALKELPGRFALHSAYLSFTHPLTGKATELESPLPEALEALL